MAKKSKLIKSTSKKSTVTSMSQTLWGFTNKSLLSAQMGLPFDGSGKTAQVQVTSSKTAATPLKLRETDHGVMVHLAPLSMNEVEHDVKLKTPGTVRMRDAVGGLLGTLEKHEVTNIEFDFQVDDQLLEAAILGLEIALYRFKRVIKGDALSLCISIKNKGKSVPLSKTEAAAGAGQGVNLARHLTNLPPNMLNPVTYAEAVSNWYRGVPGVKVEVWDETRLQKEDMNLVLAVGMASATPPRLVHIEYRPRGAKGAPVALVGKGITFDSGGLDMKPSAGMRLMKKDMGGSAAVIGVLEWAVRTNYNKPLDVYLSLAENAVGGRAFRPSDVVTSRSGQTVEIHNTDAEGRLVLADALDVAINQKDAPSCVIDVATLTGAIKVGLGAGLAGLFSNDQKLAAGLVAAGQKSGDLSWHMPLYQNYFSQLASPFADMINSADGFGGAITAALFLEKFVGETSWAHIDIFGWQTSTSGAWLESGGSGQGVLKLASWLQGR